MPVCLRPREKALCFAERKEKQSRATDPWLDQSHETKPKDYGGKARDELKTRVVEPGEEEHEDDTAENPGGLVENPVMWTENSYTFTNLEPGYHTVSVVLNHDDHTPLSPAVVAAQTFRVEDNDSGSLPVWALALGVIAGLVVGGVGVKLASSRA